MCVRATYRRWKKRNENFFDFTHSKVSNTMHDHSTSGANSVDRQNVDRPHVQPTKHEADFNIMQ